MRTRGIAILIALIVSSGTAWAQEELTVTKIYSPSATDLTLVPTSDVVLNPTGKDVLPGLGYDVNLGMLTKKYLTLHAAELWVETLVAQNTLATIGGRVLVAPTTLLTADLSSGATSITVKHNNLANGDRVYMEADGKVEFMAIASGASGSAGAYVYSVTRNLDGSGANDWYAGDAILNTGQTGNGFIDLYSVRGVKAGTEIGPTIVGNVRASSTYNDWSPRWAIGNLDGLYGYSGSTYGAAFGVPSGARVTVDSTNGIRIYGGDNDQKVTIDTSGNATFDGNLTVGTGRNMIRNSDCTVATTDWNLFTNTGLTTQLLGPWPGVGDWGLGGYPNDCYIAVTGTPSAGAVSSAFGGGLVGGAGFNGISVLADQRYEASAYIGVHRSGDTYALIQWFNSSATLISSSNGNVCTAAKAGGATLSGYCRSGVVATAPTGAVAARLVVQTTHTAELDPFIFMAHMYFGEAAPAQEDLTPWGAAGTTAINNGLIETDAINARTIAADSITTSELAADSVTSAKIVAGTIVASDIASGTITATQIAANTITGDEIAAIQLSAISADLGTITAGSITGGTIDGATVRAGSGDEVTLNSSGITISGGTGTNNRIKWTGGHEMWGTTGGIYVSSSFSIEDVLVVGGEGTSALDLTVPDLGVADQIQFVNMPSSTGTTVIWENSCGCLKKDSSSLRYKDNVQAWRPADASALLRATPITYDFRNGGEQGVLGLSAEDVYAVAPSVVNLDAEGRPDSIRQGAFNAYLLQIIKDLRAEIDALKAERQR
jgi:hypothetical protein